MSFITEFSLARDVFFSGEVGGRCLAGPADGEFLRNRLEMAFAAGWDARERWAQRERDEQIDKETDDEK